MADATSTRKPPPTKVSSSVLPSIRKQKNKIFKRPDMAPPLSIRNITSRPIELKVLERYASPSPVKQGGESGGGDDHHGSKPFSSIQRNVTSFMSNITSAVGVSKAQPTALRLADDAQSFERQEVDIRIEPFAVHRTEIEATARAPNDILRLTIEVDGERYRIDTPSPKNDSQIFTALAPHSKHELTGVFIPQETFLAVFDTANLNCWMKSMKDDLPLSALSIPGTHNSPTCYRALPSVRCQAVSPREQLENGVRMFDVRVQPNLDSEQLHLVHGVFPISLTGPKYFWDLLKDMYNFLDENPSETIILSLKREGTGDATDEQMSHLIFEQYVKGDTNRWYTAPGIPKLKEVRGKIVLLRRFVIADFVKQHGGHDGEWGIDASSWADNTPNDLHGQLCVQDFYQVLETENIDKKLDYVRQHLERASDCICMIPGVNTDKDHPVPPQPLYLNFLSASNFWKAGCWPEKIAAKLNPSIIAWLCEKHGVSDHGDGGTGIVICDWVGDDGDWDLVRCIVGMNSKLMTKNSP